MTKVKAHELRTKSKAELTKQLDDLRRQLLQLRVKHKPGTAQPKANGIRELRHSIARVLTVINQQTKLDVRKKYAGKKYLPIDLREKKTRAIRRALSPSESKIISARAFKKRKHFPQRSFAVMA